MLKPDQMYYLFTVGVIIAQNQGIEAFNQIMQMAILNVEFHLIFLEFC